VLGNKPRLHPDRDDQAHDKAARPLSAFLNRLSVTFTIIGLFSYKAIISCIMVVFFRLQTAQAGQRRPRIRSTKRAKDRSSRDPYQPLFSRTQHRYKPSRPAPRQ
ncbi:hypothetical protein, partial [Martelella mediterranea]|uniref:hypothetical protein n=1 Tax=Martelella mediterranea TaxID=293089 RepID=UPI001A9F8FC7